MDVQFFNAFYVNMYSASLLVVLLVILYIKKDIYDFSGRVFKYMIILNILLLVFEASSLLVEGVDNSISKFLNYSLNFSVFLLTPLIGYLWAIYLDNKIFNSRARTKRNYIYFLPFLFGFVLLIINFFIPVLFSINADNVYSREPLIMVNFSMLLLLFFYVTYLALANRKTIERKIINGAVLFLVFPVIGGVIQMLFYGVSTIYSTLSLGIFSTYIALETIGTSKDALTGLFNRTKASEYINELIYKQNSFGVIMIDLEDFKLFNDSFGHTEGDKILKAFGTILMLVFGNDGVVSRFGGDEFLIVKDNFVSKDLDFYKRAIYREFKNVDSLNDIPDNFKFSIGCSVYSNGCLKSEEELVIEADNCMYINKAENKNFKRRKSDR